jgi:putative Ca2+/H+ antiporter (TMEM165/GDT1 family)
MAMSVFLDYEWGRIFNEFGLSFILVFMAEMGDKSQLICLALVTRYRLYPVLTGALIAFSVLNAMAVLFGSQVVYLLPTEVVSIIVATLFLLFGVIAFTADIDAQTIKINIQSKANLIVATFVVIVIAEFGDKTQITIVSLSSMNMPIVVWVGTTAALVVTTVLAVVIGNSVLNKITMNTFSRASGILFITFAISEFYNVFFMFPFRF